MSAFLSKLWLEDVDGNTWVLAAPFRYQSDLLRGIVVVPAGTDTDLASVPDIARGLIPKSGKYNKGAVLHDAGYNGHLVTEHGERIHLIKPLCDKLFLEAMLLSGVDPALARTMYALVAEFGRKPEAQRP